jgi:MFS transporter, DHA2 family, multidrug resistance protein
MSGLNLNASAGQIIWLRIVQVLGAGLMFVPINTIAYRFIPKDQTGNASGLFALVRNEGSGIGVALVTTLLQRRMQAHQHDLVSRIDVLNPLATEAIRKFSQPFAAAGPDATTGGLRLMYAMVQRQAAILSYLDLFRMFSLAVLMVVPLVFLMRPAKASKDAMVAH